jgi:hypothetical protein
LRELQERTAAKAEVTRDSILAELEEARVMAKKNGQPAAAVSASMGKAKLVGLVVDRKEVGAPGEFADLEDMTTDELREHFAALVRSLEAEAGFGDTAAIAEGGRKGTASRQVAALKRFGGRSGGICYRPRYTSAAIRASQKKNPRL